MRAFTHAAQDLRRLIFMKDPLLLFPDVELILADTKENRNILLRHNVAFSEYRVLRDSFYDLCDIVAKYCPFRIFCSDQFH